MVGRGRLGASISRTLRRTKNPSGRLASCSSARVRRPLPTGIVVRRTPSTGHGTSPLLQLVACRLRGGPVRGAARCIRGYAAPSTTGQSNELSEKVPRRGRVLRTRRVLPVSGRGVACRNRAREDDRRLNGHRPHDELEGGSGQIQRISEAIGSLASEDWFRVALRDRRVSARHSAPNWRLGFRRCPKLRTTRGPPPRLPLGERALVPQSGG